METSKTTYEEINRRYEESGLSMRKFAERDGIPLWKVSYARRYCLTHRETGGFVEVRKDDRIAIGIGRITVTIDRGDLLSIMKELI